MGRTVGSPEIRGGGRHPLPGAATISKGGSFRILGNIPGSRNATATRQTPGSRRKWRGQSLQWRDRERYPVCNRTLRRPPPPYKGRGTRPSTAPSFDSATRRPGARPMKKGSSMIPNSVGCTFNAGTLYISRRRPRASSHGFGSSAWKRAAHAPTARGLAWLLRPRVAEPLPSMAPGPKPFRDRAWVSLHRARSHQTHPLSRGQKAADQSGY
jgi:hypothetical protein